jgi:hypothetical protein
MSEPLKRRLKRLESRLPPPPPSPGEDDPQLVDTLPLPLRLKLIAVQEQAQREGRGVAEADLTPGDWNILLEWEKAGPRLNKALWQARRKAGVPPTAPHSVAVRQLPLGADVKLLLGRWEALVSVDGDDRGPSEIST